MKLVIILLLAGCGAPCLDNAYADVTSYAVSPSRRTPEGVAVDGDLDLADIDAHTDRVEACLRKLYPDGRLPADVVQAGQCLTDRFEPTVPRDCLVVKLAPDWHLSCVIDGQQEQVFPCPDIDPDVCRSKGIEPTDTCPCECRGAIQDQHVVVTTPDLHLYDHDLIRLVTGCNFIWSTSLKECYEP